MEFDCDLEEVACWHDPHLNALVCSNISPLCSIHASACAIKQLSHNAIKHHKDPWGVWIMAPFLLGYTCERSWIYCFCLHNINAVPARRDRWDANSWLHPETSGCSVTRKHNHFIRHIKFGGPSLSAYYHRSDLSQRNTILKYIPLKYPQMEDMPGINWEC